MVRGDFHIHTAYCDGKHTPREMVEAAIAKGMQVMGFSEHGYTPFDLSYCLSREDVFAYKREIEGLKREYADRIEILCGIEQDVFAGPPEIPFDYVIGSAHYVQTDKGYLAIDMDAKDFVGLAARYFDGDLFAMAEAYYKGAADIVTATGAAIIGHIDLFTKYNEGGRLFDEADPRYVGAYTYALDRLIPANVPFELNSGAISRGYRSEPYPSGAILRYLAKRDAAVIFSSDAHSSDAIGLAFDRMEARAQEAGVRVLARPQTVSIRA